MTAAAPGTGSFALLGPLSLDVYLGRDLVLPGGGALNMAWWWRRRGDVPFELLSRVGDDRPGVFTSFLARHGMPVTPELATAGRSASIDIVIRPDLQPHMDNFVEGVWASYALTDAELARVRTAGRLHLVLVEGAIRELERLADAAALHGVEVTADFLGFRHYTLERLAETMRHVDVGFIGWPGAPADPEVHAIRDVAHRLGRVIVVTFGSRGVLAFDGRDPVVGGGPDLHVPVRAVPVRGTTVGCGDAFIAGFLASWRTTGDLRAAIEAGMGPGAEATAWRRPLPDAAYGDEARDALANADAEAGRRAGTDEG
ncbi:MAG TPA: carbohydrate kinase family protein [Candidatus Limnocylindrales bacterium]|nr:carbohydrate kinase family protein [Candidatus Limnocylindrales bacterium]